VRYELAMAALFETGLKSLLDGFCRALRRLGAERIMREAKRDDCANSLASHEHAITDAGRCQRGSARLA